VSDFLNSLPSPLFDGGIRRRVIAGLIVLAAAYRSEIAELRASWIPSALAGPLGAVVAGLLVYALGAVMETIGSAAWSVYGLMPRRLRIRLFTIRLTGEPYRCFTRLDDHIKDWLSQIHTSNAQIAFADLISRIDKKRVLQEVERMLTRAGDLAPIITSVLLGMVLVFPPIIINAESEFEKAATNARDVIHEVIVEFKDRIRTAQIDNIPYSFSEKSAVELQSRTDALTTASKPRTERIEVANQLRNDLYAELLRASDDRLARVSNAVQAMESADWRVKFVPTAILVAGFLGAVVLWFVNHLWMRSAVRSLVSTLAINERGAASEEDALSDRPSPPASPVRA
jgi:hypothetical protein